MEPQAFVNFDEADWYDETGWKELCEKYDYDSDGDVARPDVMQWFIVDGNAGRHLKEVGEVVVDLVGSNNCLFGRQGCGQSLAFDGCVQDAMIRSGWLDHVPPLGALSQAKDKPRDLRATLGGETYPFQIYGYSEHRPNRELDEILLDQAYRDAGWIVWWGPVYNTANEGEIRTFRLGPVPVEPPEQETTEG